VRAPRSNPKTHFLGVPDSPSSLGTSTTGSDYGGAVADAARSAIVGLGCPRKFNYRGNPGSPPPPGMRAFRRVYVPACTGLLPSTTGGSWPRVAIAPLGR
jgi:hypothetical protein